MFNYLKKKNKIINYIIGQINNMLVWVIFMIYLPLDFFIIEIIKIPSNIEFIYTKLHYDYIKEEGFKFKFLQMFHYTRSFLSRIIDIITLKFFIRLIFSIHYETKEFIKVYNAGGYYCTYFFALKWVLKEVFKDIRKYKIKRTIKLIKHYLDIILKKKKSTNQINNALKNYYPLSPSIKSISLRITGFLIILMLGYILYCYCVLF